MLNVIIDAIPAMLSAFANGIIAFAKIIGESGPTLQKAFQALLNSFLDAIIKTTPKIGRAITVLIQTFLKIIRDNFPTIVATGFAMLMALLDGVRNNIGKIVHVVADIITKFIQQLRKELPRLLDQGAKLIIDFIEGLSKAMDDNQQALIDAAYDLAQSIITGMLKGLAEGPARVAKGAWHLGKAAIGGLADAVDSHSPSKEAEKIGKYVVQGFIKGLDGGRQDVDDSFKRFKDMIQAQFEATKADIEDQESKLDELRKNPAKNAEEIKKVEAALKQSIELHKRAADARKVFNKDLKDEQKELRGLADQHDVLTQKLLDAKDKLKQAIDEKNKFEADTTAAFSQAPDITKDTTLTDYEKSLSDADAANEKFLQSLNILRGMGLQDTAYQRLLDKGTGIQPFIDSLIAEGPAAVTEINRLTNEVANSAAAIGATAATELKQVGVNMAQATVTGLESQISTLEEAMRKIARKMIRALKKELKIKSPSRAMMEIGKLSNEGLALGLERYAYKVDNSAATVANTAIDSIKKTLSGMAAHIETEVNTSPTITPILDLTQVTKDAAKMSDMGSIFSAFLQVVNFFAFRISKFPRVEILKNQSQILHTL